MGIAGAICAVAFAAACFLAARKNPLHLFIACCSPFSPFCLYCISPLSGKMPSQKRCCYLPSVGFAAILAVAFSALQRKAQGSRLSDVAMVVALFVAGTYGLLAIERNAVWRDDLTLFRTRSGSRPMAPSPVPLWKWCFFTKGAGPTPTINS